LEVWYSEGAGFCAARYAELLGNRAGPSSARSCLICAASMLTGRPLYFTIGVQRSPDREGIRRACGPGSGVFAGHSLRSGFLTSAAEAGASVFKMMEISRHKSVDTLRGYVRRADLFQEHAGAAFL
jgi:hypothetical protein